MNFSQGDFDEQFAAVAGFPPLHWRRQLFRCLLESCMPTAINLPTDLGNTAAMAIWLIARTRGAELPRHFVCTVDRYAVTDQAADKTEKLRTALEGETRHSVQELEVAA